MLHSHLAERKKLKVCNFPTYSSGLTDVYTVKEMEHSDESDQCLLFHNSMSFPFENVKSRAVEALINSKQFS